MKKLYDPRVDAYVETNNPALILLDLVKTKFDVEEIEEEEMKLLMDWANYCDSKEE